MESGAAPPASAADAISSFTRSISAGVSAPSTCFIKRPSCAALARQHDFSKILCDGKHAIVGLCVSHTR